MITLPSSVAIRALTGAAPPHAAALTASFQEQGFGAAKRCEIVVRPLQFEHRARGAAAAAIAYMVAAQV